MNSIVSKGALAAAALFVLCSCGSKKLAPVDGTLTEKVGDVTVTWIKDNIASHNMPPAVIFPDASDSLVAAKGVQDGVPSTVSCFLVETEGKTILFDTGLGEGKGQLLDKLAELGKNPDDIGLIYLTHYHGDHIGGLLRADGSVAFPNAKVYAPRVEHEAWMAMNEEANALQVKTMEAYKDQLVFFEFGDTLPGAVTAIAAVGHTPGHTVFQAGNLLVVGDIIHGAALQLEDPNICPTFDMDKEAATEARMRILTYARENGLVMAGMHLPEPAIMKEF